MRGTVPNYYEVFLDEGDVDMIRALRLYHRHGYDGVLIPDHTPAWAYTLGYMRAAITAIERA